MELKTLYSVGDIAWILHGNKVKEVRVLKVRTETTQCLEATRTSFTEIKYFIDAKDTLVTEEELFKSKEALIQSL